MVAEKDENKVVGDKILRRCGDRIAELPVIGKIAAGSVIGATALGTTLAVRKALQKRNDENPEEQVETLEECMINIYLSEAGDAVILDEDMDFLLEACDYALSEDEIYGIIQEEKQLKQRYLAKVEQGNKLGSHMQLVRTITDDKGFKTSNFDELLKAINKEYQKKDGTSVIVPLSGTLSKKDKSDWDQRYYYQLLAELRDNFSQERIDLVKEVGKHVHANTQPRDDSPSPFETVADTAENIKKGFKLPKMSKKAKIATGAILGTAALAGAGYLAHKALKKRKAKKAEEEAQTVQECMIDIYLSENGEAFILDEDMDFLLETCDYALSEDEIYGNLQNVISEDGLRMEIEYLIDENGEISLAESDFLFLTEELNMTLDEVCDMILQEYRYTINTNGINVKRGNTTGGSLRTNMSKGEFDKFYNAGSTGTGISSISNVIVTRVLDGRESGLDRRILKHVSTDDLEDYFNKNKNNLTAEQRENLKQNIATMKRYNKSQGTDTAEVKKGFKMSKLGKKGKIAAGAVLGTAAVAGAGYLAHKALQKRKAKKAEEKAETVQECMIDLYLNENGEAYILDEDMDFLLEACDYALSEEEIYDAISNEAGGVTVKRRKTMRGTLKTNMSDGDFRNTYSIERPDGTRENGISMIGYRAAFEDDTALDRRAIKHIPEKYFEQTFRNDKFLLDNIKAYNKRNSEDNNSKNDANAENKKGFKIPKLGKKGKIAAGAALGTAAVAGAGYLAHKALQKRKAKKAEEKAKTVQECMIDLILDESDNLSILAEDMDFLLEVCDYALTEEEIYGNIQDALVAETSEIAIDYIIDENGDIIVSDSDFLFLTENLNMDEEEIYDVIFSEEINREGIRVKRGNTMSGTLQTNMPDWQFRNNYSIEPSYPGGKRSNAETLIGWRAAWKKASNLDKRIVDKVPEEDFDHNALRKNVRAYNNYNPKDSKNNTDNKTQDANAEGKKSFKMPKLGKKGKIAAGAVLGTAALAGAGYAAHKALKKRKAKKAEEEAQTVQECMIDIYLSESGEAFILGEDIDFLLEACDYALSEEEIYSNMQNVLSENGVEVEIEYLISENGEISLVESDFLFLTEELNMSSDEVYNMILQEYSIVDTRGINFKRGNTGHGTLKTNMSAGDFKRFYNVGSIGTGLDHPVSVAMVRILGGREAKLDRRIFKRLPVEGAEEYLNDEKNNLTAEQKENFKKHIAEMKLYNKSQGTDGDNSKDRGSKPAENNSSEVKKGFKMPKLGKKGKIAAGAVLGTAALAGAGYLAHKALKKRKAKKAEEKAETVQECMIDIYLSENGEAFILGEDMEFLLEACDYALSEDEIYDNLQSTLNEGAFIDADFILDENGEILVHGDYLEYLLETYNVSEEDIFGVIEEVINETKKFKLNKDFTAKEYVNSYLPDDHRTGRYGGSTDGSPEQNKAVVKKIKHYAAVRTLQNQRWRDKIDEEITTKVPKSVIENRLKLYRDANEDYTRERIEKQLQKIEAINGIKLERPKPKPKTEDKPKVELPKTDSKPKVEIPKVENKPKVELPKVEPKPEAPKTDNTPKVNVLPKAEEKSKVELPHTVSKPKVEVPKVENKPSTEPKPVENNSTADNSEGKKGFKLPKMSKKAKIATGAILGTAALAGAGYLAHKALKKRKAKKEEEEKAKTVQECMIDIYLNENEQIYINSEDMDFLLEACDYALSEQEIINNARIAFNDYLLKEETTMDFEFLMENGEVFVEQKEIARLMEAFDMTEDEVMESISESLTEEVILETTKVKKAIGMAQNAVGAAQNAVGNVVSNVSKKRKPAPVQPYASATGESPEERVERYKANFYPAKKSLLAKATSKIKKMPTAGKIAAGTALGAAAIGTGIAAHKALKKRKAKKAEEQAQTVQECMIDLYLTENGRAYILDEDMDFLLEACDYELSEAEINYNLQTAYNEGRVGEFFKDLGEKLPKFKKEGSEDGEGKVSLKSKIAKGASGAMAKINGMPKAGKIAAGTALGAAVLGGAGFAAHKALKKRKAKKAEEVAETVQECVLDLYLNENGRVFILDEDMDFLLEACDYELTANEINYNLQVAYNEGNVEDTDAPSEQPAAEGKVSLKSKIAKGASNAMTKIKKMPKAGKIAAGTALGAAVLGGAGYAAHKALKKRKAKNAEEVAETVQECMIPYAFSEGMLYLVESDLEFLLEACDYELTESEIIYSIAEAAHVAEFLPGNGVKVVTSEKELAKVAEKQTADIDDEDCEDCKSEAYDAYAESFEGDHLIMEAVLEDLGVQLTEGQVYDLIDRHLLSEKSIVRLDKAAKRSHAEAKALIVIAREQNDPLYKKLAKIYKQKRDILDKLDEKYGSRAIARVRKTKNNVEK